jgi:TRAP-type uncharacterized transport system fused permease subunit
MAVNAISMLGILFGVHFEACHLGLKGLPKEQLPNTWKVLKEGWHFLIPIGVLIFFLGVIQYTPIRSGFYAIITAFMVSFFRKETRLTWERFLDAVSAAARNTITVALACAAAGLVIGSINLTGAGLKLSAFIIGVSGGHVWLALLLTALVALIMGMGLPTTAAYIVVGTMAAPALVEDLKMAPPPTEAELKALRAADPANLIIGGAAEREKLAEIDAYVDLTLSYARR